MGSFTSNFLAIVILAMVTFVVLDINQSDVYESKYLFVFSHSYLTAH